MRITALLLVIALMFLPVGAQADENAGDEFRITVLHTSSSEGDDGSSSSSSGRHEYVERILDIRADGVERLYDLPLEPDADERLINWQFPVRVFEANDGEIHILNRDELEGRRDDWLEAAEIPAKACGTWYFTWNAFQVECDPDAITETILAIKIQPESLAEGAELGHPAAMEKGRLTRFEERENGAAFIARMPVNSDYFHRAEAQGDVVVGEIMREPISFEQAYSERATTQISGTIEIILEAKPEDQVWKRTTLIETIKTGPGGEVERMISTETVEREVVAESR